MSIDATHSTCMAKFINNSPDKSANCQPNTCVVNGIPHLLLYAKKYIAKDSELRYDYGDSSNQQWRKSAKYQQPFTISEVNAYLRGQPLQKNQILTESMDLSCI
ncbi:N-lysine methyltransferase KMT5A-like isoform X2 [Hydra vulgaris]|uniref:N-lysine methyltransferase KMT5A-like isoform X2 n=2 Tax=Hydra vulgaris TaxID=6087 RepID=A0ABM4BVJ1_HYDVU